jgi:hypothetical protein
MGGKRSLHENEKRPKSRWALSLSSSCSLRDKPRPKILPLLSDHLVIVIDNFCIEEEKHVPKTKKERRVVTKLNF